MLPEIFCTYAWIAKSIPFPFLTDAAWKIRWGSNDVLVRDREVDGLSVLMGMF